MNNTTNLAKTGVDIVENIFDEAEIEAILCLISEKHPPSHFALRCLLLTIPTLQEKLWNEKFISLLHSFSPDYQLVRAIYVDKQVFLTTFFPKNTNPPKKFRFTPQFVRFTAAFFHNKKR